MEYMTLAYYHLGTIIPAFLIGSYLLLSTKGTKIHRYLGASYALLMLVTASITLFMPANNGPRILFNHFGYGHIFSIVVYVTIFLAIFHIKNGNVKKHRQNMLGSYFGALIISGVLAFLPGRFLHGLLFT